MKILSVIIIILIVVFDITVVYFASREKEEENERPRALIIASKNTIFQGEKIILNGSGSNDIDGKIIEYKWDFGNGEYSFIPTIEYYFEEIGYHNITLTVTDNLNKIGTNSVTIEVKESVILSDVRLDYSYDLKLYLTIENKGPGTIDTNEDYWILNTSQGTSYHPGGYVGERYIQSGFTEEGYLYFNSRIDEGRDLKRLIYNYMHYYVEVDLTSV